MSSTSSFRHRWQGTGKTWRLHGTVRRSLYGGLCFQTSLSQRHIRPCFANSHLSTYLRQVIAYAGRVQRAAWDVFSCMFSQLTIFLDAFEGKSPSWKHPRVWRKEGVSSSIGNSKLVKWKKFHSKTNGFFWGEILLAKCHLCLFLINLLKCLLILRRF